MLYSQNEILTAFPKEIKEIKKPELIIKPIPQFSDSDDFRYKINKLDNRMMLSELS